MVPERPPLEIASAVNKFFILHFSVSIRDAPIYRYGVKPYRAVFRKPAQKLIGLNPPPEGPAHAPLRISPDFASDRNLRAVLGFEQERFDVVRRGTG